MIRITGTVEGEIQFSRAMTRLVAGTHDLSEPFEKIGEDVRDIWKEVFDSEGFGGWAPLSAAYAAWKQLQVGDKPILEFTRKLRDAMTRKGFADNVSDVKAMEATFGAEGEAGAKGHWHQLGTKRGLPQRKIIAFREQDKRQQTKTMHTYMVKLGRDAGFQVT